MNAKNSARAEALGISVQSITPELAAKWGVLMSPGAKARAIKASYAEQYSITRRGGAARPVRPAGQLANRRGSGEIQGQVHIESGVHYSSQQRTELGCWPAT